MYWSPWMVSNLTCEITEVFGVWLTTMHFIFVIVVCDQWHDKINHSDQELDPLFGNCSTVYNQYLSNINVNADIVEWVISKARKSTFVLLLFLVTDIFFSFYRTFRPPISRKVHQQVFILDKRVLAKRFVWTLKFTRWLSLYLKAVGYRHEVNLTWIWIYE